MPETASTVAIVEDDASMRRSVERLLGAHGFRSRGYASAEEFLAGGVPTGIGCVVLDIHLGGMTGIELRRRLTAVGSDLSVIFITAVDDEMLRSEAREAGYVDYLRKPFPASSLIAAVNAALASIRAR